MLASADFHGVIVMGILCLAVAAIAGGVYIISRFVDFGEDDNTRVDGRGVITPNVAKRITEAHKNGSLVKTIQPPYDWDTMERAYDAEQAERAANFGHLEFDERNPILDDGGLWDADPDVCCAAFQTGACSHTEGWEYEVGVGLDGDDFIFDEMRERDKNRLIWQSGFMSAYLELVRGESPYPFNYLLGEMRGNGAQYLGTNDPDYIIPSWDEPF